LLDSGFTLLDSGLTLLGRLAWPAVALIAGYAFREDISKFIGSVTHVKFPGLEMDAAEKVIGGLGAATEGLPPPPPQDASSNAETPIKTHSRACRNRIMAAPRRQSAVAR